MVLVLWSFVGSLSRVSTYVCWDYIFLYCKHSKNVHVKCYVQHSTKSRGEHVKKAHKHCEVHDRNLFQLSLMHSQPFLKYVPYVLIFIYI